MAKSVRFEISPLRNNPAFLRFVRELEKRMQLVSEGVVYEAAKFVLDGVRDRVSDDAYAKSLELVRVSTRNPAFAVTVKTRHVKVRKLKEDETVLYVRPKTRKLSKTGRDTEVLMRYSPWTLDTLPFYPSKRKATVISRRVTQSEFDSISKSRSKDKHLWLKELADLGVRPSKKLVVPAKAKVVPDAAFESLRAEFGIGGGKKKPHWRPTLRMLSKTGIKSILSPSSSVMSPLYHPFRSISDLSFPTDGLISESEASKFEGFVKRLGSI